MIKIIYIHTRYFTLRDYHRFGAEYLENKGYDVELWRVYDGITLAAKIEMSAGMYNRQNMFDLSLLKFERKVRKNRNALYILHDCKNVRYMYVLAKYHCKYFLIQGTGRVLMRAAYVPRFSEVKKGNLILLGETINQKRKYFSEYMAEKFFCRHLPEYVFLGVDVKDRWLNYLPDNRKIYVHSYDYDRYLETTEIKESNEYILYIDSGFGNIDVHLVGEDFSDPWKGKTKNLWKKMEEMFRRLEDYYRLPVIVAGHPHTAYASDFLFNRKIVYNKTPELVKQSKFVIMQWSTSISFALLFKKDILILIDNDFKKVSTWNSYYMPNYKYFGVTPCNMDREEMAQEPWKYVYKIDNELLKKYISTYIKKAGTPDYLFIEVIEKKINEIMER